MPAMPGDDGPSRADVLRLFGAQKGMGGVPRGPEETEMDNQPRIEPGWECFDFIDSAHVMGVWSDIPPPRPVEVGTNPDGSPRIEYEPRSPDHDISLRFRLGIPGTPGDTVTRWFGEIEAWGYAVRELGLDTPDDLVRYVRGLELRLMEVRARPLPREDG